MNYSFSKAVELVTNYDKIIEQYKLFKPELKSYIERTGSDKVIKILDSDNLVLTILGFEYAIRIMPCISNQNIYGRVIFAEYFRKDDKLGDIVGELFINTRGAVFFSVEEVANGWEEHEVSNLSPVEMSASSKAISTHILLPIINKVFDIIDFD
ncbi:hypothetical protein [Shewanella baltica]|uniref:hypothetical protein n=1 Tax=Shewanella baltica TaxID=62322 RepID=UPI00217E305A|nr:hypothetical protein [Shewanella baltica]MCS6175874.1 hypothetical protein [Shewanella baltica]